METATKLKYGAAGFALAVALTLMIAFKGGFLITKSDSERLINSAVLTDRANVCVGQFKNDPRYAENVKTFKTLSFIDRDAYIAKGGWDKMPGDEKAVDGVNRLCGDKLAAAMDSAK